MKNGSFVSPAKVRRTRFSHAFVSMGLLVGATASVASWTSPAHASRAYAYVLTSEFGFGGGCPSCHNNLAGGFGTATQPFGVTMMSLGLVGNDVTTLYDALTVLQTSNLDSDGDTIADFDELSPDGDPNDPAVFPADAVPVPTTPPVPPPPATVNPQPTSTAPAPTAPAPTTPAPTTPTPSPAPSSSSDDGGCSVTATGSNVHWLWLASFAGATCLTRRRKPRRSA